MAMEQVNLQELQRLNDAITVTFDAIRRVAPQIQALQQMAQMQLPFTGGYGYGMGMQNPWQQQQVAPLVHMVAQQIAHQLTQQLSQQQQPWGQGGWGQQLGGFGQHFGGFGGGLGQQLGGLGGGFGGIGQQYGQQYGQVPFGMQSNVSPFQQYGQRPF